MAETETGRNTDFILTVGRYVPDTGAPEGRFVRTEEYLAALSREAEQLCVRLNTLLRELDARIASLEGAAGGGGTA